MNTLIEQKMKEFEEKFTQEGPLKTYREMRHEYYLNCTDIEAFIRRAMEESYKHGNIDGYAEGWNGYKSRYKKDKNSQPTK
jgi:hypothetical protein